MYVDDQGNQMIREWYIDRSEKKEKQGMREYLNTTGVYPEPRTSLIFQSGDEGIPIDYGNGVKDRTLVPTKYEIKDPYAPLKMPITMQLGQRVR